MKRFFMVFFILFLASLSLQASTLGMHRFTCPLCTEHFESRVQNSYSIFGQNLDLKPVGAAVVPAPVPKCPKCGLVFQEGLFSAEETVKLKEYLTKNNIFVKEPGMPNYYYLARELEILNKHIEIIVFFYLSSVWENKDKSREWELMDITIDRIDRISIKSEEYETYQLVKLDLLRRSGRFWEAKVLIEEIRANESFCEGYIIKVIDYQAELILIQDQKEHALP